MRMEGRLLQGGGPSLEGRWTLTLASFLFTYVFNFIWGLPWVLIAMHGLSLVVASGRHFLLQCSGFLL